MRSFNYIKFVFLPLVVISLSACVYMNAGTEKKQEEKPVTLEEFNRRVANKDKAVLVFFHAKWCLVCAKMKPTIEEVEKDLSGKLEVMRIDTDRDKEVTDEFEVDALPLLILYKNGEKKWIHFGLMDKNLLNAEISKHL